ncbi:unnamed protein product [Arctia plantaginis]|uniref:Uncharacterized protein n=1 Tax=Arctia plantaginis TaxID=874455 RepID=A0A8S0Z2C9_ARCPL|nr:unnamed protein product [Arctia plantaginis]
MGVRVLTNGLTGSKSDKSECWMSLRAPELFRVMEKIDKEYALVRKDAQKYIEKIDFNKRMLELVLAEATVAYQEVYKAGPLYARIPGGLPLGGPCMMKLPDTVLFFHRMKLRNDTFLRVNVLHNDMVNMVLRAHLSVHGLHLKGAYDHTTTGQVRGTLVHTPTTGELGIFLEDIKYTIEGRYRFMGDRLVIELIVSTLSIRNMALKYPNATDSDPPVRLLKKNMADFRTGLKTDLDKWVQDYFNGYLIVSDLQDIPSLWKLREYDQYKTSKLAAFTDLAVARINKRILDIGGDYIRVPKFKIVAAYGLVINIYDGALRGLDTMYRRSVATTVFKRDNLRYVDAIIGFKDLEVSYRYVVNFPPGPLMPPSLTGVLRMSAKDLTAHLSLGLLMDPEVVELDINFINPPGADDITIEGAANILMSNFKHILRYEIATIMSNSLMYGVGLLRTLPRCEPFVPGMLRNTTKLGKFNKKKSLSTSSKNSDEARSKESNYTRPQRRHGTTVKMML